MSRAGISTGKADDGDRDDRDDALLIDPTAAPSPSVGRRSFLDLSAGAAATLGALGIDRRAVGAATTGGGSAFGKPHPPIVAEDDPAILAQRVTLTSSGRSVDAYAASPRGDHSAARRAPGVVVVQAVWGVDAQLRDVVRRFAKAGYVAIAPDLYAGMGAPSGDASDDYAAFRPFAAQLDDRRVDADLAAAAAWIAARKRGTGGAPPVKIGVTGFCMGGGIALRQALAAAPPFAADAVWYGRVRYDRTPIEAVGQVSSAPTEDDPFPYASAVKIPLLGSYGARDTNIAAADVRAFFARIAGPPHDVKIYAEAGHAFFDDTRSSYVPSAASDAWQRTLRWFATYLRG